jgi:eukaryotic-like serine/threonine-protein kinase
MGAGRFEVIRKIATGGMAEIYLARQESFGGFRRNVAIKRILPKYAKDKRWVASFLNEASLAAMLNHPNIVQVYDVTQWNDTYLLTMEYLDGFDLEMVLRAMRSNGQYIPFDVVLTLMGDVLSALDFAHNATDPDGQPLNVVHRDISPSNIFLTSGGQAKVVDFGIAKANQMTNDVEKTRAGTVRGKVAYLSPEQIGSKALDARSDVFACGVMLYELLVGDNPFKGRLDVDTLNNILRMDVKPPKLSRDDVHPGIWDVVKKALTKDRSQRYQSCAEMLEALESLAEQVGLVFSRMHTRQFFAQSGALFMAAKKATPASNGGPSASGDLKARSLTPLPATVITQVPPNMAPPASYRTRVVARVAATVLGAAAVGVAVFTFLIAR